MFLQQLRFRELLSACLTWMPFRPNAVCTIFMPFQINLIHISSITSFNRTFGWLFARMNEIMSIQIARSAEEFSARLTWERFRIRVSIKMEPANAIEKWVKNCIQQRRCKPQVTYLRWNGWLKLLAHTWHMYGNWPVWVRKCTFNEPRDSSIFLHTSHSNCLSTLEKCRLIWHLIPSKLIILTWQISHSYGPAVRNSLKRIAEWSVWTFCRLIFGLVFVLMW